MFNHSPIDYINPFQVVTSGVGFEDILTNKEDIFYKDDYITALIASSSEPQNQGNVLIIPNLVFENLYDIPDDILSKIHIFSKRVAVAMKETYNCDGVSLRQHNEPAGDQEVWHYHLHVIPRYDSDDLYPNYPQKTISDETVRAEYANKLRDYLKNN